MRIPTKWQFYNLIFNKCSFSRKEIEFELAKKNFNFNFDFRIFNFIETLFNVIL